MAKTLLERVDVNPDSPDCYGRTLLSYVAGSGHEGVVEILLGRGNVNPDLSNKYGRTPLLYAAGSSHDGVVKLLSARGDINLDSSNCMPGFYYHTLLDLDMRVCEATSGAGYQSWFAARFRHKGVAEILLEREDVNPVSSDGYDRTPLFLTVGPGRIGVVRLSPEPRSSSHQVSSNGGLTRRIPVPPVG